MVEGKQGVDQDAWHPGICMAATSPTASLPGLQTSREKVYMKFAVLLWC